MNPERSTRTRKVLGDEGLDRLENANVLLFGCGGVGSYAAEALVRSGIGSLTIVDKDIVDPSNINRQLIALGSTVGREKVEVEKERLLDINPDARIDARCMTFLPEDDTIDFSQYDYVIDAVDMVTAKLAIIERAKAAGVPVLSVMGTGNKLDPERLRVTDISKTSVCPLAKVMRKELRDRRIRKVDAVWSDEVPKIKCTPPGSFAPVPGSAGLMAAAFVVRKLLEDQDS